MLIKPWKQHAGSAAAVLIVVLDKTCEQSTYPEEAVRRAVKRAEVDLPADLWGEKNKAPPED